jgi:UDP-glucose-4-epimerase GalE
LPVTFDNLERGQASAVRWGPLERGDIRSRGDLREAFVRWRPWAVMHLAGYAYVGESNAEPLKYYETNVGGLVAVAEMCVAHECLNFVFSSSCATYGTPDILPIDEEARQQPINPYGWSKYIGERVLLDAARAHGLRPVALRYFNATGADPDGEIGEDHASETHVIPLAIEAALGLREAFTLFGDDYPTPDGTCVRDYVHVSDLASGHVTALQWLAEGGGAEAFNLCNERGYSVAEVLRTVEAVIGRPAPVRRAARRPGDPPVLVGKSAKARQKLSWRPRHPDLFTQVQHAARWKRRQTPAAASAMPVN